MRRSAVLLLLVALVLTGCKDQKEKYCDALKDHREELGSVLGDGGPDALLKAEPGHGADARPTGEARPA